MRAKVIVQRVHAWSLIDKYRNVPTTTTREHDPDHIWDMLRYDLAFINAAHPEIVLTIRANIRGRGTHKGDPTVARWSSFGYKLVEMIPTPFTETQVLRDAGAWVTYQHPRHTDGRVDYGTLAPLTLKEWMERG